MPDEAIPQDDVIEGNAQPFSVAALLRARKAELARMVDSPPKQETSEADFESGGDFWSLLKSVNRD